MQPVPPLTLLYTVFTYYYEIANIGNPRNIIEDLVNKGQNVVGTVLGAVGIGGLPRQPVAFTNFGRVRGTTHRSRNGMQYFFFKGIPYARPPVGELRFEPPVPHPGWHDIWDATSFRSECPQISILTQKADGSENCLFLNIATRKETIIQNRNGPDPPMLFPVIFWIHGGMFVFGGSNIYLPKYWMDEPVVVVTVNYRLGSFGFLNSGDGLIKGNNGFKDMVAALKWVNENIHFFYGDRDRITIIGESAGGASVHYLTISPMSRGLFSRAISLSGTALGHWAFTQNSGEQTREFAASLGCQTFNSFEMVSCLKAIPTRQLLQHQATFFGQQAKGSRLYFGPSVDSGPHSPTTFLYAHPRDLLKNGHVDRNVPWITGVVSGEGCINVIPILRTKAVRNMINSQWHIYAPVMLGFESHPNQFAIADMVKSYYLNGIGITEQTAKQAVMMFSDRSFYLDNHEAALLHSRWAPVYAYYWNYVSRFSLGNLLLSNAKLPLPMDLRYLVGTVADWLRTQLFNSRKPSPFGTSHADDLPMMFSMPGLRPEITMYDVDYRFSQKIVHLFASFAENGIPNAGDSVQWYTVGQSNSRLDPNIPLRRLRLSNNFEMIFEPFFERMEFWKNVSVV